MSVVDLIMPKLGESIMEATILKWHKQPGDKVQMDETVLEIATDKVDSEVPSTAEGTIESVLFKENDVVPIGSVIARINTSSNGETSATSAQVGAADSNHRMHVPQESAQPESQRQEETPSNEARQQQSSSEAGQTGQGNRFYSPLVLTIAGTEGVSMTELEKIRGTGNEGRVTKKDILQYVAEKKSGKHNAQTQAQPPAQQKEQGSEQTGVSIISRQSAPSTATPVSHGGNVEIIEMDRMRKLIAKHMVDSVHTSPHVTSFSEADVTNMVLWREKAKKEFEKRENEKLTFTPLFIEAIVKCLKKYPWLNSSLDGDRIVVKKDINIGMATALPSGNLIVPVIRNADQLNLVGLTRQVNNLAQAARNNKLKPDDTSGGTFTLTNVGSFGSIMGTPIINQPQVAILAVGAIKKKPVVIETEQGDAIAIRHMMYLSMSYDHRIIDGALGATFLNAVAKELENFSSSREV